MAISDLTGTTWVFKDDAFTGYRNQYQEWFINYSCTINGVTNNYDFLQETIEKYTDGYIYYAVMYQTNTVAWDSGTWTGSDYKTITITGGTDVTSATLIAFLEENADEYVPPEPVANKVIFGNTTIMDITDTTATESDVASGMVFYKADGTRAIGTMSASKTNFYGQCPTSASTTAKSVTCDDWTLTAGNIIGILFSTANTAAAPTLNINNTGAIAIRVGNSAPSATTNTLKWSANTVIYFMYDGTYYRYINAVSAGSVTQPRGANNWFGACSTAATTAAKASTITNYVLTNGSVVYLNCTTANTVQGAITLNINSTGAKSVYYNNAVTSATNVLLWEAGETLTFVYTGSYYYFVGRSKDAVNANGVSF